MAIRRSTEAGSEGERRSADLRRRLARGWSELLAMHGYGRTTVQHLVAATGVSRNTFYRCFGSKEKSFVLVHGEALDCLTSCVRAGTASGASWEERVAQGIEAALKGAARRPCEAWILVGEPFAAGPRWGYCQELLIDRFGPMLVAGRPSSGSPRPPCLETAILGGLVTIVSNRLRSDQAAALPALAPELVDFALTPYLGTGKARCKALARAPSR
jgi:AcrR family transcriptional regulator